MACIFNWICICGVTSAYWIGYGSSFLTGPAQWRFPVAFQAVFSIVILVLTHALPESPRWLEAHGFSNDARRVISRLLGSNIAIDDDRVEIMYAEIKVAIATEKEESGFGIKEMFAGGDLQNGRRMLLCLFAGLGCQMSGINLITQCMFQTVYTQSPRSNRSSQTLQLYSSNRLACPERLRSLLPASTRSNTCLLAYLLSSTSRRSAGGRS